MLAANTNVLWALGILRSSHPYTFHKHQRSVSLRCKRETNADELSHIKREENITNISQRYFQFSCYLAGYCRGRNSIIRFGSHNKHLCESCLCVFITCMPPNKQDKKSIVFARSCFFFNVFGVVFVFFVVLKLSNCQIVAVCILSILDFFKSCSRYSNQVFRCSRSPECFFLLNAQSNWK